MQKFEYLIFGLSCIIPIMNQIYVESDFEYIVS